MIKILIVDDSQFMRTVIKDILTKENYKEITEAKSYEEGLSIYKKEKPDLILLDAVLPHKSGIDLLKEIRKKDKETKVVIISSVEQQATVDKAHELGVSAYIMKPFEEKKMLDTIKKVVG